MDKKIFEEAIVAFAQHARNMQNAGYIEIASLLTRYAETYDPEVEAKIVKHAKGEYAADWIETHVNEPERHSLASAYWLAATSLQNAEEFGTPIDVEMARRKLNKIIAAQTARGYR